MSTAVFTDTTLCHLAAWSWEREARDLTANAFACLSALALLSPAHRQRYDALVGRLAWDAAVLAALIDADPEFCRPVLESPPF